MMPARSMAAWAMACSASVTDSSGVAGNRDVGERDSKGGHSAAPFKNHQNMWSLPSPPASRSAASVQPRRLSPLHKKSLIIDLM